MKSRTSLWLELGIILVLYFLWLMQKYSFNNWWQLVSLWVMFFTLFKLSTSRNLATMGLLIVGFFAGISWLVIFAVDSQFAFQHWRSWLVAGLGYLIASHIDWQDYKHKYLYGSTALLLLTFTSLFGEQVGGAKAWLSLGGFRFQPIEFARIFILLFLAGFFYDNRQLLNISKKPSLRYWGPVFMLMAGAFLFLAAQRDLGPALLFYLHFVTMVLYISFSWHSLLFYFIITATGFIAAWTQFGHFRQRVAVWINPWVAAESSGYQILQGLFAINSGGMFGSGLGFGMSKAIPAVHTDYIFALVGEELGFIGSTLILLFYLCLLFWGVKIAKRVIGKSHILASAIVLLWGYQIFIVIGGILRVLPLSGMTLPFLSYGGSSLLANMWLLGMLTSLSRPDIVEEEYRLTSTLKLFRFLLVLFCIMGSGLFYWQVIRTDLASHPYNPRAYTIFQKERGCILDRNGELLAFSSYDGKQYQRKYSSSTSLSHLVGYFHQRYGMTGLEGTYNNFLSNNQNVHLTIDLKLQQQVEQILAGHVGAIVVMHTKTGQLLAVASSPTIDSNLLAENWVQYQQDSDSPFFNRALNGMYPPGSTIKPLLLAAAVQEGTVTSETVWQDQGTVNYQGQVIRNFSSKKHGIISSQEALALSSNVVFAELGVDLKDVMLGYYLKFGLTEKWPIGLGQSKGNLPIGEQFSAFGWAQLGIGQGKILVTPLQMAVAISTIANGGTRLNPYLVQMVEGNLFTRRLQRPVAHSQVITQSTAADVREAMILAVEQGTAQATKIPGVTIAGKTGTAETAQGLDHSWFVGFSPDSNISVVVLIEHGGAGGARATPLAKQVFLAILEDMEERLIP